MNDLSEPELTEPVFVSDDSLTTESDIQPGELSGDGKFTWQVIIMLIVVVVTWATPNVVGRYLAENNLLTPTQISALRYIPAALTLLIVVLATKNGNCLLKILKLNTII